MIQFVQPHVLFFLLANQQILNFYFIQWICMFNQWHAVEPHKYELNSWILVIFHWVWSGQTSFFLWLQRRGNDRENTFLCFIFDYFYLESHGTFIEVLDRVLNVLINAWIYTKRDVKACFLTMVRLFCFRCKDYFTFFFYSLLSDCSLNSLNCSNISGCHTDRTLAHTPPNQDGRATPSPEHVSTADSEYMHNFDDSHTSVPRGMHGGFSHMVSNSSTGPKTTNNATNTKETEHTDENFNSFHYWRSPLPDISGELEMLSCQKSTEVIENQENKEEEDEPGDNCRDPKSSPGQATSDQIQKVLDCLQPHMDDPDVQGGYTEPEYVWYAAEFLNVDWTVYVNLLSAQVQVLSAALKAAQLDSPTDDSPAEPQPEEQPESNDNNESLSVESKSVEVQSETQESPEEEEQMMETPPALESSPVQEQGDEETQTEPLEDQEDQEEQEEQEDQEDQEDREESPPGSPVLVQNRSLQCVKSAAVRYMSEAWTQ